MKVYHLLIFIICIGFNSETMWAQAPTDSTERIYFSEFKLLNAFQQTDTVKPDTMLQESFFYDKLKMKDVFYPKTGNPGSAVFTVTPEVTMVKFFNDGFNQYENYIWDPLATRTLPANRRFTNLDYHLGSKKEQHIVLSHDQKIKPWFLVGLDFAAMASPGDFSRQKSSNRSFDIYLKYESPSRIYRGYISYTANRVLNEENGGISNDSIFENATSLDTRTVDIKLTNATTTHKIRDYLLKQELNLTRIFSGSDSATKKNNFNDRSLILSHSIWWNRKSVLFTSSSADSGYFNNFYFDSLTTYDSSFYNDLYQVAMLEYSLSLPGSKHPLKIGAGFEFQDNRYDTGIADTSFNQGAIVLAADYASNQITANFGFTKSVYGSFNELYRTTLNVHFTPFQNSDFFFLNIAAGKLPQSMRDRLYVSNHFIWSNNFDNLEMYDISVGYFHKKWNLGISGHSEISKNKVFYREDYLPQVFSDYVMTGDVKIYNSLKSRRFGWDNRINFYFSENEQVIPVPLLGLFSSVYYHNLFFKSVLGFRAGIDATYNSEYYGHGYMPATGIFYVQHEKQIGNYPQFGAFINLNIKSKAKLFIRLDHFNAGLTTRAYYGAYHYPLPGRTFKFGISWDLVD